MRATTVVVMRNEQQSTLRGAAMGLTRLALTAGLALSTGACAPVFSELQSARLVGVGRTEVTPAATANYFTEDGETNHVEDHYGIQAATGVHERIDLRVRYVHASGTGEQLLQFSFVKSFLSHHLIDQLVHILAVAVGCIGRCEGEARCQHHNQAD